LLGLAGGGFDDGFQRLVGQRRVRDQLVEVVHITLVVLAVVKTDGVGRDMGAQSIVGVGQRRQGERTAGGSGACGARQREIAQSQRGRTAQ